MIADECLVVRRLENLNCTRRHIDRWDDYSVLSLAQDCVYTQDFFDRLSKLLSIVFRL